MIRRIHYFSAELKTKIDVIPRGCFKFQWYYYLYYVVRVYISLLCDVCYQTVISVVYSTLDWIEMVDYELKLYWADLQ